MLISKDFQLTQDSCIYFCVQKLLSHYQEAWINYANLQIKYLIILCPFSFVLYMGHPPGWGPSASRNSPVPRFYLQVTRLETTQLSVSCEVSVPHHLMLFSVTPANNTDRLTYLSSTAASSVLNSLLRTNLFLIKAFLHFSYVSKEKQQHCTTASFTGWQCNYRQLEPLSQEVLSALISYRHTTSWSDDLWNTELCYIFNTVTTFPSTDTKRRPEKGTLNTHFSILKAVWILNLWWPAVWMQLTEVRHHLCLPSNKMSELSQNTKCFWRIFLWAGKT